MICSLFADPELLAIDDRIAVERNRRDRVDYDTDPPPQGTEKGTNRV